MKTGEFKDPEIHRWVTFPCDRSHHEDAKRAALELLAALKSSSWYAQGKLPIHGNADGSLDDELQKMPELKPYDLWRRWGERFQEPEGTHRRVSAFFTIDTLVLAFEISRAGLLAEAAGASKIWNDLEQGLPRLDLRDRTSHWGVLDHRILEYTGELDSCCLDGWDLNAIGKEESHQFLAGSHKDETDKIMFVYRKNSAKALEEFLAHPRFAVDWLAALKVMRSVVLYPGRRHEMDNLPKSREPTDEKLSLEEIEELARVNARSLRQWQLKVVEFKKFRITNADNVSTLCQSHRFYPELNANILFSRQIQWGDTLCAQLESDEAYYQAELDELGSQYQVWELNVQIEDARYARKLNQIFVILGILAAILSLGQIYADQIKNSWITPPFWFVILALLVRAIWLMPRDHGKWWRFSKRK
jgi:hypothetical protein